jgi:alkaline phosphatase D
MLRPPPRILLAAIGAAASLGASTVRYSDGAYHQSFDSLPAAAHNSTGHVWQQGLTLPGWHASRPSYSATDGTLGGGASAFVVTSVADNVGLLSFGAAGSSERALGLRSTGTVPGHDPALLGVGFVNSGATTLTQFSLSYLGEQWLQSDNTFVHTLVVEYKVGAAGLADASGWTEITAARFSALKTGGTPAALDGNAPAHRVVRSGGATGLSWAPGQSLWIRFRDHNEPGNEHGLAVDNFSFEAGAPPATIVTGPWSGNITPSSATVSTSVDRAGVSVRAVASLSPDFSAPHFSTTVVSSAADAHAARLELSGLQPDTEYHYAIELDGALVTAAGRTGRFRTFPLPGPASFQIGFGACGHWDYANQYVYDALAAEDIRFFIHTGDFNYLDTNTTDPAAYRSNYRNALSIGRQGPLLRRHASAYVWDDHDFSGDDSDRTSLGRMAHRQVYRELVPHYPLPDMPAPGDAHGAIYHGFTLGRVRFILTDLRSDRDPVWWTDNASKSIMGAAQKAWFKQQLLAARDAETPLIVWVSSVPFISLESGGDNWGRYRTERTELLEFIRDQRVQNIVILSGDMHGLAADDGRGTDAYVSGVRIPVFHAASFNRGGSVKGGPYSHGTSAGESRYGLFEVADDGVAPITVTYRGKIAHSATDTTTWATVNHTTEPVRPLAPLGLTATPDGDGVALAWTDRSDVESGYRVERAPSSAGPWTVLGTASANAVSYDDATAAPTTAYAYRVVAVNGVTEAAPTATVAVTTLGRLQRWKFHKLGAADASDDDDRDGDGRPALLEYALGGEPALADQPPGYAAGAVDVGANRHLTLSFTRHPERADVRYLVQAGSDLVQWEEIARSENGAPLSGPAAVSGEVAGIAPRVVQVRDPQPVGPDAPRRFLRVRAER